jgi:hypothetical protein
MADLITRIWENLIERTEGPMHFRFLLQPLMSLIFAFRSAIRDAKTGTVPYLWRFMATKNDRKQIATEAWKDVGKVFILAVVLDVAYQLTVIFGQKQKERFYPLESLVVAILLAIVPYVIFRGPLTRLLRIFISKAKKG